MVYNLKEIIEENVMVFTRTLGKDYQWFYYPFDKETASINKVVDIMEYVNLTMRGDQSRSEWQHFNGKSGTIILRRVEDGRTDMHSRPIRRIEGTFLPREVRDSKDCPNRDEIYEVLEQVLTQKQIESNNYGYGQLDKYLSRHHENKVDEGQPNLERLGDLYQDEAGNLFAVMNGDTYAIYGYLDQQLKR